MIRSFNVSSGDYSFKTLGLIKEDETTEAHVKCRN